MIFLDQLCCIIGGKMKFKYTAIVAVDEKGGMAKDRKIPWHCPEDLKSFVEKTTGKHCLMGRVTFEQDIEPLLKNGLGGMKYLPNKRMAWVVSRTPRPGNVGVGYYRPMLPGVGYLCSPEEIEEYITPTNEIMVIGGLQLYQKMLPVCDVVYLTEIKGNYNCDKFFPINLIKNGDFQRIEQVEKEGCTFYKYVRKYNWL